MENNLLHKPHAGEILKYEFLEELDISNLVGWVDARKPNNNQ
jgi:plasmid maintenance system antidote protein VapI